MRLTNSSRFWAATGLVIVAVFCAAFIGVWLAADLSISDLVASDSPLRNTTYFLLCTCIVALALALVLFSPLPVSKVQRLALLGTVSVVTLLSLGFAQIVFITWLFPLWSVWRFYREPAA
jgi:phosphatidylserine synthase